MWVFIVANLIFWTLVALILLNSPLYAQELTLTQKYWTPRRKVETVAVTALHIVDATQTCWHMGNTGWHEHSPVTPDNCAGASVAILGEGAAVQYLSYRLGRRWSWFQRLDNSLPGIEIGLSINAVHCSYTAHGCNRLGF